MRLLKSKKPDDKSVAEKLGVVLPNQANRGTHVNVSGAGVLKNAPHREAAVLFLEYLASDEAQNYFANGNNEWPAVQSVKPDNPALATLGKFKIDALNLAEVGKNQPTAQKIADRSGFK
ncbi:Iron uptake protein A2 precursor [compost metagenome]